MTSSSAAPWQCRCGRGWSGLLQAHCSACHEHFSTVENFDRHRPSGRCRPPAALTRTKRDGDVVPVLKATTGPYGVTWVAWSPDGHPHAEDAA